MILLQALISSRTKSTCCQKIHHWTVKTSKRLAKLCPAWCPHQFKSMQAGYKIIWTKIWNLRVLTRIPFSVYFPDISNSRCSLLLYTVQLNSTTQQPSNQPPARSDWIHPAIPKKEKNTPTHFIITTGCNILIHFGANLLLSVSRFHHGFWNAFHHGISKAGDSVWLEFLDPVARAFPSNHLGKAMKSLSQYHKVAKLIDHIFLCQWLMMRCLRFLENTIRYFLEMSRRGFKKKE